MLALRGIEKSFGGVRALAGVDLEVRAGEVHALVGENGAGKSTLIRVVSGAHPPDAGEIELAGARFAALEPRQARELGIAVIYQQPALLPELTVAENLFLGRDGAWIRWRARRERARELLARVQSDVDPLDLAGDLTIGQQQQVEIARALGQRSLVLVLDEPTAALSQGDAARLLELVRELRAGGTAVVYVTHRLEEVFALADRVTVLRDGRRVSSTPTSELDEAELIRRMVGREVVRTPRSARSPAVGPVRLRAEGLRSRATGLDGASLEFRPGEILGLAGLVGAGRTALGEALVGLAPLDGGFVELDGARIEPSGPADALRAGIAYLPEDRLRHGVIGALSVVHNVTLPHLASFARRGLLRETEEVALARRCAERLAVKAPSLDAPVRTLSGGNQQKVALARWLAAAPKVLVLDEPTQGVDVAARAEIHRLVRALAGEGLALLLISSDMEELLELSDRVAVMRRGRVVAELGPEEATPERVLALALGSAEARP